jgi:hypothetical protein
MNLPTSDQAATRTPCAQSYVNAADRASVRAALVDLLTHGPHPDTATPGVLADVGAERARRAAEPPDPWSAPRTDLERLANLTAETGVVGAALATGRGPTADHHMYAALTVLAATVLAWLDQVASQITDVADDHPF